MPGEPGAGHAAAAGGEAAPGGREQGARGAPPEHALRIVVVGARGVGKSALAVSLSAVHFVAYSVNITHTTCQLWQQKQLQQLCHIGVLLCFLFFKFCEFVNLGYFGNSTIVSNTSCLIRQSPSVLVVFRSIRK